MKTFIFLIVFISVVFSNTMKEDIQEGVFYYKHKQYEKALEIFDRVLIKHPKSKRARLEYARVLYALGRYKESKAEFLKVLKQNPPPLVKKNIKWFIRKIDKKIKTDFFNGSVTIGSISDSNIENKSDNPVYAGFIDTNTEKRKDRYITTELFFKHTKKLKNSLWQNTFYFYDEYEHNQTSDKITYINLGTSYKFLAFGIRVSIPISFGFTNLATKRYLQTISVAPNFFKKVSKNNILYWSICYEKNKNLQDNEKSSRVLGVRAKWLFNFYKFRNSLGLGYKDYEKVSGERIDISKNRESFDISTSYSILRSNIINLFYRKIKDIYKDKDPSINDERVDKIDNFNINLQQFINKKQYFQLGFSKVSNRSNLDIYSYDKNIFSLKITQTF